MENQDCYDKITEPKYECLLFDLDDTLYPLNSGISAECTKNIIEYMINELCIEKNEVAETCARLYRDYGTTLAGLRATGYHFDYDHYHRFVHGRLPYEWLKPDHTLRNILHSLPMKKIIFSNGDDAHVAKVLSRLGLEDCFDDVICFETLNPLHLKMVNGDDFNEVLMSPIVCKPLENAFEQAFKIADINPRRTLFFDDSIRNLQAAKNLGVQTVWIGNSHRTKGVDFALESLHNLKEALPDLWETMEKSDVLHSEKIAIETFVRA